MKKIFASDNALRVLSVFIAIIMWIYIAIVMDSTVEVTVRDLPIQFIGQESLEAKGLAVLNESETSVTVKIKGSRKKMGNNDMKSIIVTADVSDITKKGSSSIPISVNVPFAHQEISSQSAYSVDITVEEATEKTLDVEVMRSGTLAQDYAAGDVSVEPKSITIKGSKSAIDKITKAVVRLKFSGEDVDIDKELPVEYVGVGDKEISSLDAALTRISSSAERVRIHCPVLKIKKIDVKAYFGNQNLPEGFSYKTEPSAVYVYSDELSAAKITEIKTEEIWLDKLMENGKVKVKLNIPDKLKIIDDVSEVEITVENKQ